MNTPTRVRAGVLPAGRAAAYLALGAAAGATTALALLFAPVALAVLAGLIVCAAVTGLLLARDAVIVTPEAIQQRNMFSVKRIEWNTVQGADFTVQDGRWALTLDAREPVPLLSLPPVTTPVSSPADLSAHDRLIVLRKLLHDKKIPISIETAIATGLHEHWRIAPPT